MVKERDDRLEWLGRGTSTQSHCLERGRDDQSGWLERGMPVCQLGWLGTETGVW